MTKTSLSSEQFESWGWRVPFWVSIFMVLISYIIRRNMHESPLFAKAKAEGKISKNPLKESFGNRLNLKFVLLALFGATMGQGVVWYTGQFYAMSFIQKVCNIASTQSDSIIAIALLMGTPFFVIFGALSDKIGRKPIMMLGMLIAIISYRPIYKAMYETTDLNLKTEVVDQTQVNTTSKTLDDGNTQFVYSTTKTYDDGTTYALDSTVVVATDNSLVGNAKVKKQVTLAGSGKWSLILLIFVQVIFVTMVYGPIAAFLVEMFPVNIRYTSMSLPYHVGNGIFGGLLPTVSVYLATKSKAAGVGTWYLEGLWYPIIIAGVCFLIGVLYINGKDKNVHD